MSHLDQKQSSSPANQALERLIAEHAASGKSVDQRPTAQQTLRVGVINNVNNPNLSAQWLASCDQFLIIQIESTTDLSATKIPSTAEIVTNDSIVRDTFDIVIDLSNDTNKTKAFSLAQAHRSAVENSLFLIHSETKTPTDLLPNVRHSIGITTGEWSGQRFVELIATPETALQVIERACAFSENFAHLTLVTRSESQGMLWKIQCSYLVEAMALVGEAADPALIEQCAADAGMREPPLMALDVISLKLMDHILHDELHRLAHAKDHRGHSHDHGTEPDDDHDHDHDHEHAHSHSHDVPSELMPASAVYVLEKMAHGFDRLGVNYGAGFYDYDYDDDPPALWDGLTAFARGNNRVDPADVADRLLFAPAIQFLHCLSDGYSDKLIKANLGAVIGAGFSATAGGPVGFIRKIGLDSFAVRAGELAARYGSRFDLPDHWQTLIQSES